MTDSTGRARSIPADQTSGADEARDGGAGRRVVRAVIWMPGLAVALGAAVATAHGLYEVAAAARVPAGIAWLYPLITDGLALLAYTATTRLHGPAARYAWAVVVLAAGLSGLAQASYLAGAATLDAPPALRFGVGAWPAIAAAIVAHLLYLLATATAAEAGAVGPGAVGPGAVGPGAVGPGAVGPGAVGPGALVEPATGPVPQRSVVAVQAEPFSRTPDCPVHSAERPAVVQPPPVVQPAVLDEPTTGYSMLSPGLVAHPAPPPVESPARDRARAAAERHAAHHGGWPTVTQLEALAQVSRGTAAAALKALREHPSPLHLVADDPQTGRQP